MGKSEVFVYFFMREILHCSPFPELFSVARQRGFSIHLLGPLVAWNFLKSKVLGENSRLRIRDDGGLIVSN